MLKLIQMESPLAEKRIIYSLLKRALLGRRCYSDSMLRKKTTTLSPKELPVKPAVTELIPKKDIFS